VATQLLWNPVGAIQARAAARETHCLASCFSTPTRSSDIRPTHSEARPTVVYRVDTRAPAEIFAEGFSAGTGMNLVDHVLAANPPGDTSAFVATTDDPIVASRIAMSYRRHRYPVWIHEIRADGGLYGVCPSLRWIIDNVPDQSDRAAEALATWGYQSEWVAISHIPSENIRRAYRVDTDLDPSDFRHQISVSETNSLYVDAASQASNQILPN
jgi:hypothetical protein